MHVRCIEGLLGNGNIARDTLGSGDENLDQVHSINEILFVFSRCVAFAILTTDQENDSFMIYRFCRHFLFEQEKN